MIRFLAKNILSMKEIWKCHIESVRIFSLKMISSHNFNRTWKLNIYKPNNINQSIHKLFN